MNEMVPEGLVPQLTAVLESLPLSIAVLHRDGSIAYANAPAHKLAAVICNDPALGLSRLTASPPPYPTEGTDRDSGREDSLVCDGEGGIPLVVLRQWRECGDTGLHSVTIRPARGGGPGHVVPGTAALTELEAKSHDMMRTDKLATVGQLAAGMAHEINNPICYVQSNLGTFRDYTNKLFGLLELGGELLRDNHSSGAERYRAFDARKQAIDYGTIVQDLPALLEESSEGVERIRHIVQSLRDFSRNDPDQPFQLYDVRRALDSAVDIVRSLDGQFHNCTTKYDPVPLIECNPTELNQLFMNILVNASHAIDAGGHIGIHARLADANHVQIEISDDGCGMDEEVLSHLFEPFFTTKAVGKGTGLGMPISYGIVKKHRGDITVKSAPGRGTTFTITLPIKHAPIH